MPLKASSQLPREFLCFKRKFKSGLEESVGWQLYTKDIPIDYENVKVKFEQPTKSRSYTPDFILPNGIIVETKGRFVASDRSKHRWVKEQYPELDIRFVFSNPRNKIYKGSKTTYADWCKKYGFLWAEKLIPEEWFLESPKDIPYSKSIIRRAIP